MSVEPPAVKFEANVDQALVRSLAREFGHPETEVERIMLEELRRITVDARINTFVKVLAASSVRSRLREERAAGH